MKISRNPLKKMRKIKNKYEILVIIRKVKMTKRMLKSKLTMVSMLW